METGTGLSNPGNPRHMVVSNGYLYWTDNGQTNGTTMQADGVVFRVPLPP